MAYVALKPCKFAGQSFKIGESVPAGLIQPGAAMNLVKMKIIAEILDENVHAAREEKTIVHAPIKITLHTKEGDLELCPKKEGLQAVFDAMTATISEAEGIIKKIKDEDALILLNAADSRKSIKAYTEERAKALR